jgi:glycine cleavage system regulatory protein
MQSDFIFTYRYKGLKGDEVTVNLETNKNYLPDILEEFANFLRGCGFTIHTLEHVKEEEDTVSESDGEY